MHDDLKAHIQDRFPSLIGPWVSAKSAYEAALCRALAFSPYKSRYFDARWNSYHIELKKGTSIWIDLVRYGEILLATKKEAKIDTVTLFFIPNKIKDRIDSVICVPTKTLIEKMSLDLEAARFLIELQSKLPRQLNAQASLTVSDVRTIASFSIPGTLFEDWFN